jgi:thiol:disulfide interchange protein DsbD
MINEQSITPLSNGGFQIKIEAESFEAEPLPFTDRIGGLLQLQVGDQWIQTEVISAVELAPANTPVNKIASPLLTGSEPSIDTPKSTSTTPTPEATNSTTPEKSIFEALLLAFFGGMLLNIMPCVLPVLSLKLFGLIEQADITKRKQRIAGLAYTGGIIASFLALATAVIILQSMFGLNIGWGFQFQYPAYVIGLATIVFVFGLSMLGVFEVPAIGSSKAHELSQKEGWMEYFMIGVFATLLATPCSAPFLGTGIGFAFTLPPAGILLFFGIAGLGLAFPFLLIAFVPAFFKLLPQPGAWMETFKEVMGFTLIATTVWLVDVLGAQTGPAGVTGFLSFATVVALGAWIFGKWGSVIATTKAQITSFLIALGLSTVAGFLFLTTEFAEPAIAQELSSQEEMDFSEHIPWQPFSDENIDALKNDHKAIFIDFTADWCLSCKVNEKNVLETETIRNAMKTQGIVPVKADWTRRDESISRWLKEYGKAGVPFYLFIKADGTALPLPEVLTTNIVLEAFES